MAGLQCAKVLIDQTIQMRAQLQCIESAGDLFRDTLPDKPTDEAMVLLKSAHEQTKKAFAIINAAVVPPETGR